MSIDKEQVLTAVRESFAESEELKRVIPGADDFDNAVAFDSIVARGVHGKNRSRMWDIFSEEVWSHIQHYAIKQYGDFPNDQVTKWNEEQLKTQIEKYLNRLNSNSRGEQESDLDLIKIAHYAQMIWSKRLGFEDAFDTVLKEREDNAELRFE